MPSFTLITKKQLAPKFRGRWIYFGEDYLDMCRWEKWLGQAERLSYAQWLPQTFKELRGAFIQWVSDLGKPYGDSLDWWMTRLSGRNPLQTPIFLHICYVDILHKHFLGELSGECLIVCEDWYLLRSIEANLKRAGYPTKRSQFWQARAAASALKGLLDTFARWGYALSYQLFTLLVVKLLFRKEASQGSGKKKQVIIHTCVDEACLGADGKFHDRYFAGLSEWLETQGYQVRTIPWLFNVKRPAFSAYLWLKRSSSQFLIPENYLQLTDYVKSVWRIFRGGLILRGEHRFSHYNVTALIKRERLANYSAAGWVKFLLYIPFFERWTHDGNHCDIFIDMFENMPCERPLIKAVRQYSPETLTVGYQHATIPDELMGYGVTIDEWGSRIFPDRIVTNGPASAGVLAKEGFPADAIATGPAFRYSYLFDKTWLKPCAARLGNVSGQIVTVLLPLDIPAAVELLLAVVRQADRVMEAGLCVELKIHPMLPEVKLMRAAGLSQLPSGWGWAAGSMHEQLGKTVIAIGMGTAALLDAAAAGVPILCLGRELGFPFNPLEFWGGRYAVCRTVNPLDFPQFLEEMIETDDKEAAFQLTQLSSEIIHGLGRLDDEYMFSFVRT